MHEPLQGAVEAAAVAEVAVERHADAPGARPVEARRRERAQRPPLLGEALGDREAPARVGADVCPAIALVGVLAVELGERREAPRRPEAVLEVADGRFDCVSGVQAVAWKA